MAWCGLAQALAFTRVRIMPPFGQPDKGRFLWADSWRPPYFGVTLAYPIFGCVMVFTRDGGGHVAQLEDFAGDYFVIRGGNQTSPNGGAVNVTSMHKSKLTAA